MADRACNECGKTVAEYSGYGLCITCYKRLVWRPRGGEAQDRDRAASRAWKESHKRECEDCGQSIRHTSRWCQPCFNTHHNEGPQRQREAFEPRRQRIVALWNDGLTLRQIAVELGTTRDAIGTCIVKLRQQGYDLPYRRTPEQVERIREGSRAGRAA